jgi:hypothetical protein
MEAFWTPTERTAEQVEQPIFDIHKSPLRGQQCCTQWRIEHTKEGNISVMRFFHIHCRKHARNCEYCPETRIAPGVRAVPIRVAAAKTLLKMQEQDMLEDD